MASPVLLYPGETSDLVDVDAVLRARHEERAAAVLREIERRKASGAPLDDGDGPIEPLGDYESHYKLEGVKARFVVLSEKRRRMLSARELAAWARMKDAKQDPEALAEATEALFDVRRAYVAEAVAEVRVGPVKAALDERGLDILERNHLITPLFSAAAAYQDLSPGKVSRSGSSLGSTSGASTVASAPSTDVVPVAVMVGQSTSMAAPPSSPAPATQQTLAHGGTC